MERAKRTNRTKKGKKAKKSRFYLIICITCYVITFPFIPIYLLIDRLERKRAEELFEKMDSGYQPGYWDKFTLRCWKRY